MIPSLCHPSSLALQPKLFSVLPAPVQTLFGSVISAVCSYATVTQRTAEYGHGEPGTVPIWEG